jgi:hypothetical protein
MRVEPPFGPERALSVRGPAMGQGEYDRVSVAAF